jgi:hypothetical protein
MRKLRKLRKPCPETPPASGRKFKMTRKSKWGV